MTFQKGVKFRIYPNREQRNLIDRTLGCSRLIYNKGLAMREDAFKSGEKCGYKQTSAMLTALKQDVNYAFLKEVDSIALQQALRNLDTGYTNFFEHRAAHPKFKNKKSSKQSYHTLNIGRGLRFAFRKSLPFSFTHISSYRYKSFPALTRAAVNGISLCSAITPLLLIMRLYCAHSGSSGMMTSHLFRVVP